MKKKLSVFLFSAILLICLAFGAAGCSSNSDDGGSDIKTNDISVSFISEDDYTDDTVSGSKLVSELNCQKDDVNYMLVDLNVQAKFKNSGDQSISVEISISPTTLLSASMDEANSGNWNEYVSDGVKTISVVYKVPDLVEVNAKTVRIVVKLCAIENGIGEISVNVKGAENTQLYVNEVTKGVTIGATEELTYSLIGGTYTVTGVSSDLTDIMVPTMYNGYSVTAIGSGAFAENTNIRSIIIVYGMKSIGERAFYGCTALSNIDIPASVASIGDSAFFNCTSLSEVNISYGVKSIGDSAFNGCTGLSNISIPDSIISVGASAFYNCNVVKTVMDVQYVDNWVVGCSQTTVSIVIKDGTRGILGYAFSECTQLKSITIPQSVVFIGAYAFSGVGNYYESYSENYSVDIRYSGTKAEWNAINKQSGWDESLGWVDKSGWNNYYKFDVVCADGTISVKNKI